MTEALKEVNEVILKALDEMVTLGVDMPPIAIEEHAKARGRRCPEQERELEKLSLGVYEDPSRGLEHSKTKEVQHHIDISHVNLE
ncbi:hypothetical protein HPP92_027329 [Vanilla planifolia]|uniref:Uncharacterized protein n=1 Tax=Vanilla planifolia TaxID=51239 RepID=A0A835PCX2_VANPL|nr:hypothetical protein HPP92_027329 [Vanilla planifolia]